jgi:hypothetical protein
LHSELFGLIIFDYLLDAQRKEFSITQIDYIFVFDEYKVIWIRAETELSEKAYA